MPLWLLAIINIGIFYQDENLANRIQNIAALMIAFVALIPTIRAQIPPNPNIVFVEILVYLETFTSLMALIDSLSVINYTNYTLTWQTNGLFLVSCIITVSCIISIAVMMILHYLIWQPRYHKKLIDDDNIKFSRNDWQN